MMKRREFLGLAALPLAQALNQQPVRSLRGRVIGSKTQMPLASS
jgi:hypothetical protein